MFIDEHSPVISNVNADIRPGIFHYFFSLCCTGAGLSFIGAFLTDFTYSYSPDMQWTNFSAWLLAAGILFATVAGIFGLLLLVGRRRMRISGTNVLRGVVLLVIYGLSVLNNFIHTRDAWTSVVPTGLALSAATACLVIVAAILRGLVHRDDARWEGV